MASSGSSHLRLVVWRKEVATQAHSPHLQVACCRVPVCLSIHSPARAHPAPVLRAFILWSCLRAVLWPWQVLGHVGGWLCLGHQCQVKHLSTPGRVESSMARQAGAPAACPPTPARHHCAPECLVGPWGFLSAYLLSCDLPSATLIGSVAD